MKPSNIVLVTVGPLTSSPKLSFIHILRMHEVESACFSPPCTVSIQYIRAKCEPCDGPDLEETKHHHDRLGKIKTKAVPSQQNPNFKYGFGRK